MSGPLQKYVQMVQKNTLKHNPNQLKAAQSLQNLYDKLHTRKHRLHSFLSYFKTPEQQGVYLYGGVGTGKSMLMDLFHSTVDLKSQRFHYHQLMQYLHSKSHSLRSQSHLHGHSSITQKLAHHLHSQGHILCIDEFQVLDIVDAMLLKHLVHQLLHLGSTIVITSNRHPQELYKNGIQRSEFIPVIDLILKRLEVVNLETGFDFRKLAKGSTRFYFAGERKEFDRLWEDITGGLAKQSKIEHWGRELILPAAYENNAYFSFDELCKQPLSSADYLHLSNYKLFIHSIPQLEVRKHRNEIRRFINLIDALYDSKRACVMQFECVLDELLCVNGKVVNGRSLVDHNGDGSTEHNDDGSTEEQPDEIFSFQRTLSRLQEMQTWG